LKLYDELISNGPTSVYAIAHKLDMPPSTVHRIFKNFEKLEYTMIYEKGQMNNRPKIIYGVTIPGIFWHLKMKGTTTKSIEKIFDRWINYKAFLGEIEGKFGKIQGREDEVRKLFVIWIIHHRDALNAFEKYDEEYELPLDDQLTIGRKILYEKNSKKITEQLAVFYANMPMWKKAVIDDLNASLEQIKFYQELDKWLESGRTAEDFVKQKLAK